MAKQSEDVLLAAFVGIETAHFYSSFLPSIMTIQKFKENAADVSALRKGELLATTFSLSLGFIVSRLMDSDLPLIFAAATAALMLVAYESAIRGTALTKNPTAVGIGAALVAVPFVPP